jgi:hypothetical protein
MALERFIGGAKKELSFACDDGRGTSQGAASQVEGGGWGRVGCW